ncbi:hypothetical protein L873DRAFT_329602 [Choiromyces venosus 120613-1]|uniref:Uncharacterized protein n=1 Tax=Choiromyces venosus 120613-1 TaxID=1336337 RepID=A0A3N4K0A8_9PEZI|nr:hypothetical protein L873DRAFT_329602 [Choiromyces venosus 120613-1]
MPVSISHNQIFPGIATPDVMVSGVAVFSMSRSTPGKYCNDVGIKRRHSKPKIRTRATSPKKVMTYWGFEIAPLGSEEFVRIGRYSDHVTFSHKPASREYE